MIPRILSGRAVTGAALFALAAGVRLFRLDRDLRHEPNYDERVFVDNALGMIERGDWDHKFYEYPGLLFWVLRVLFMVTGARGADAFLEARVLLALAAAGTVLLVYAFASSRISTRAAVVVAVLLALSPLENETVRMFRPDVALGPIIFAALALASSTTKSPRVSIAWLVAAAATAIKFSAALVFVPLAAITWSERRDWRPVLLTALAAFAFFALLSPYTFLAGRESVAGMATQVGYHYEPDPGAGLGQILWKLGATMPVRALSLAGVALVALGTIRAVRDRASWLLGFGLFPIVWIGVFSSTGVQRDRFLVPILGSLCVLAAYGFEGLARRSRPAAIAIAVAGIASSAMNLSAFMRTQIEPPALDQALDWVNANAGPGLVGTSISEFGALDQRGREITVIRGFRSDSFARTQFDALVLPAATSPPPGYLREAVFASPRGNEMDTDVAVYRNVAPPRFEVIDPGTLRITSSDRRRDANLSDGSLTTRWGTDGGTATIGIVFQKVEAPARLELAFGGMLPSRELSVTASDDQGPLELESVRAPLLKQRSDASQLFAWAPRPTTRLEIRIAGAPPVRIGELRLHRSASGAGLE